MQTYKNDPKWIRAKFRGKCCRCHAEIKKGDLIYWYPLSRAVYCDGADCGVSESRSFESSAMDDDLYSMLYC